MRGHEFVNEVQTVAQVFFPLGRVRVWGWGESGAAECDEGYPATLSWEGGVVVVAAVADDAARAVVYINGAEVAARVVALDAVDVVRTELSARRVLMLAMFHALRAATGADIPWGALTGIRPSKMVRSWLAQGKGDAQILRDLEDVICLRSDKARLALDVAHAENRLTQKIFESSGAPLGIYIGVPFCPSRCAYCSFNMAAKPPTRAELTRYVTVLVREIKEMARHELHEMRHMGKRIASLYIGGGTPTVLPDDLLATLLDAVGEYFAPGADCEYTVEAGRPDTLTPENLRLMREFGVGRIAVNPQTLNDRTLQAIGRNHTAADFVRAFMLARDAGFATINADLIAALPGEGEDDLRRSVEALLPLRPENLTIHTLSIKRASRLRGQVEDCNDGTIFATSPVDMNVTQARLRDMGYAPYYLYRQKNTIGLAENIGYSLPGHECLYNIGMMSEIHTVLGIGAGAVTKYVEGGKINRKFNEKNPQIYMERRA